MLNLAERARQFAALGPWLTAPHTLEHVHAVALIYAATLARGGTLWFVGNGGSAADAQHLAAEYVGGMSLKGKPPLAAAALTVDTSVLTAIGNDYGFKDVFRRQTQALVRDHDTVTFHSTSGASANLTDTVYYLRSTRPRVATVALLGPRAHCVGSGLATYARYRVFAELENTGAVQVAQLAFQHLVVELVEEMAQHQWKTPRAPVPQLQDPSETYGT